MGPTLDISIEAAAWRRLDGIDRIADRAVAAVLSACSVALADDAEISLVLADDAFVRELNRTWRGKDRATNVLSFPTVGPVPKAVLGDIVIAYETSVKEAETYDRPLADYLTHLIVHGLFHLLGFDHETDADAVAMERLETRALLALGIASPYVDIEELPAQP